MTVACPAGLSPAQIEAIVAKEGIGRKAAERAVRRLLGAPGRFGDDREDIVEEICVHIWRKLSRRNTAPPNLEAWVRLTAKRKALNLLRGRQVEFRRQVRVRDALAQRDGRSRPEIDPDKFERALSDLPDHLRRVCDEVLEGRSLSAVARILGISPGALRRRLDDLREPFLGVYEDRFAG
jgi:RNA polymerase sigma factor (sigma-70 family)